MSFEDPENSENGNARITRELQQVHEMLSELEAMQPPLHEDIAKVQANIDRISDKLENYDALVEQRQQAGELEDSIAFVVGRAMNDIAGDLEALIQDKDLLLNTRMALENAVVALRERADELLEEFPKDTEH
jgi:chromosome segregation ATPase